MDTVTTVLAEPLLTSTLPAYDPGVRPERFTVSVTVLVPEPELGLTLSHAWFVEALQAPPAVTVRESVLVPGNDTKDVPVDTLPELEDVELLQAARLANTTLTMTNTKERDNRMVPPIPTPGRRHIRKHETAPR